MTALNTTWSPNSFQLRLAFNSWKSPAIFIRVHVRKLDRQVRVLSVAGDSAGSGREVKEPSIGNSWINSNSSADDVSGWSGADEEQSIGSERKSWFGGIAGAGVAGIILVAALTFATSSVSKRKSSKLAQGMEPLTTQQETILAADDQYDRVVQDENEGKDRLRDDGGVSKAGIDNDSSSSTENNGATNGNGQNGPDMASTINNDDAINNASIQDDLQNEAATDDMLVVPHVSSGTTILPDSESEHSSFVSPNAENSYGDLITERSEQAIELKENLIDSELTNFSVSNANPADLNTDQQDGVPDLNTTEYSNFSFASSFNSIVDISNKPPPLDNSDDLPLDAVLEPQSTDNEIIESVDSASSGKDSVLNKEHVSAGANMLLTEEDNLNEDGAMGQTSVSTVANPFANEQDASTYNSINESTSSFESTNPGNSFSSAGIPAPSVVSAALQVVPGKVLVPAVVDQVQGQALSALQVLKVIEAEVQPGDLCTRREYARWLVSASSTLSRNTASKVYPAMYIENVTELAFDDITPEDPDFPSIQGLAEAGLISSKLSRRDMSSLDEDPSSLSFFPESPLSRQDLVSWKMALEKRQLPEAKRKILHQFSGFLDIDKINPDAWPALLADVSAGENGIIALAFGFTRLFQPEKPVTKAQAAIALATGEASDIVSEELARIEAESMAENAVAAHTALVAQVEKDVNASFEKELLLEREKVNTVERLAEEARQELERLKAERERDDITLMKERAAVESEMEVLARLRHEVAEQMESLMSNKVELSFEKERLSKLLKEAEFENQEITRLQHELEVERKALSMARSWAEDEAKRAREQAKILEEARDRWESRGIKIVVDNDLREEENVGVTWLDASKQFTVEGSINRAESLVDKLKAMAADVSGKAKLTISKIIQKMLSLISVLEEWASRAIQQGGELKDAAMLKMSDSLGELKDAAMLKMSDSLGELQQSSAGFTLFIKEGAKRVAEDCKEGVEKLTHKFKT